MVTARFRTLFVLPAVVAALLLSGCADPETEPGGGGSAPAAPSSLGSVVPVPGPSDLPTDLPTAGGGKPVTVDGIVEPGVEPGCRVLIAGGTSYLLLGGEDVPLGVRVRVTGVLQPGVLTTCQQGTPLRVTDVQRR